MNYPEYQKDLQRIHESEVYGLAVFDTAAKLTRNPERKKKWLALKALEQQTLDRYLDYMQATNQPIKEPKTWRLKGYIEGTVLGLAPWGIAMKLIEGATGPFQEKFLRLKQNAEGADKEFFTYVYAHEKALEMFAQREQAKDPDSLKSINTLLAK